MGDKYRDPPRTAPQHTVHVVRRRALSGGHDSDPLRAEREEPLSVLVEKPFRAGLPYEPVFRELPQPTGTRRLYPADVELELPAPLVDPELAEHRSANHRNPVFAWPGNTTSNSDRPQ
jgi:hypothetical protein